MNRKIQNKVANSPLGQKLTRITSRLDIHTLEVVKKSSASMVVKIVGMIAGLLVSIVLGRTLGANGLGIINLTSKLVNLILIVALFGMQNVIIKEIAIAYNKKNWQHIGNCMNTAYRFNGVLTLFIVTVLVVFSPWLSKKVFREPQLEIPLIVALVATIPMVFSRIYSSGLIGYRKIWQSNLVNQTMSLWIVGILLLIAYLSNIEINIVNVAIMYATGRVVVSIITGIYWNKLYSYKSQNQFILQTLLKPALPMLLVSASSVIAANADAVMLGWLGTTEDVGYYTVAARLALLTSFFLQVSNAAVSPKIASLYADGKIKELEKMVQKVTGGLSLLGIATLLVFIVMGKLVLGVWGDEFKSAYWILVILGIGQFVNLATGAVGLLLIMTGHEKVQGKISFFSVILNLIINYALINKFGAIGAALASALTISGENIAKLIMAKRKTGVSTLKFVNLSSFK